MLFINKTLILIDQLSYGPKSQLNNQGLLIFDLRKLNLMI